MATNTLLQKLDGETDFGSDTSNRSQIETFIAGGTVEVGEWVMFDVSQTGADRVLYVIEATTVATHGNSAAFGCVLASAEPDGALTSGSRIRVTVGGYHPNARVDSTTSASDLLVGPIGTAGEADPFNPGTTEGRIIGQALEDASAGGEADEADVWIFKTF